jgi:hypothetical protein
MGKAKLQYERRRGRNVTLAQELDMFISQKFRRENSNYNLRGVTPVHTKRKQQPYMMEKRDTYTGTR